MTPYPVHSEFSFSFSGLGWHSVDTLPLWGEGGKAAPHLDAVAQKPGCQRGRDTTRVTRYRGLGLLFCGL